MRIRSFNSIIEQLIALLLPTSYLVMHCIHTNFESCITLGEGDKSRVRLDPSPLAWGPPPLLFGNYSPPPTKIYDSYSTYSRSSIKYQN